MLEGWWLLKFSGVRLAEAQRSLGTATREDVTAALRDQIAVARRLLGVVEEGSDLYYELVDALRDAQKSLGRFGEESDRTRYIFHGLEQSIPDLDTLVRGSEEADAAIGANG